ncbi:MAG: molybdopterin converting factor subunit 1 [Actinobacteria bacterium]|nr:molybdopterin converting factor subunit 1 [Actinomycetota bacterium]
MITARLFARLREQAGTDCEQVELAAGTLDEVYDVLRARHPALEADRSIIRPARNQEFARWSDPVTDGDEVAFIPPVSGGSDSTRLIRVADEPLDPRETEAAVARPQAGAIASFLGVVRDSNRGEDVAYLEYEAYGEMAERELRRIAEEIGERWPGSRVAIVHRTGRLEIGEASVAISVSSPNRAAAFEACRYAIEQIKVDVPIWKKEHTRSGQVWLEGPQAKTS